jgi:hypothetical protein
MNVTLIRNKFSLYGIFGVLTCNEFKCVTLEHAYPDVHCPGFFQPKLAPGTYTAVKRKSPKFGYNVFLIEDVPPFQGAPVQYIEIHRGNYNKDSEGCVLLGEELGTGCILESEKAFNAFMELMENADTFTLSVQ